MIANLQYSLSSADIELVLALARGGTLAAAADRLLIDASTVFRALQRIERGIGQRLFERTRAGYLPNETALSLVTSGERIEAELERVRSTLQVRREQVSGVVRITATDTVLHGLVTPTLAELYTRHPHLSFDLQSGNELANLTKRDADIAVRATQKPPQHLIGKQLGPIEVAVFAPKKSRIRSLEQACTADIAWIAPDDALPEHPSVLWRKRRYPKIIPAYRVSSILTAAEAVAGGLGVAALPVFLAAGRRDLQQISGILDECRTELWLLAHPDLRHLRRVSVVFAHLAQHISLG